MPSMTEDLGRIASGIAASRQRRQEADVRRRHGADSRHRAVSHQLHAMTTMRRRMSREQRKDLAAGRRSQVSEVEALLRQLRRNREEMAAAARMQATAFMRDLSSRVVTLRDAFSASQKARAKSRHDLAKALQERLAGYQQDRRDAGAAWGGVSRHTPRHPSASAHGRHRTSPPGEHAGAP